MTPVEAGNPKPTMEKNLGMDWVFNPIPLPAMYFPVSRLSMSRAVGASPGGSMAEGDGELKLRSTTLRKECGSS